jgi:hypothetical protein
MKRIWLMVLMLAGSLVALNCPAFAQDDKSGDSSSVLMEDVNSALGAQTARISAIEKALGSLKFYGDIRARYAYETQFGVPTTAGVPQTIADSSRGRYRVRFGLMESYGDFSGAFRLATGAVNNPNSENNTYDTAFDNPTIDIDTASLTWTPKFADKFFSITAGKMNNPLTKSPITWDPDIQPEGVDFEVKQGDFAFRATYFELQNLFASGTTFGNIDVFMDNLQAEYGFKMDADTTLGVMAGYEYIPNSTLLVGGSAAPALSAVQSGVNGKTMLALGNVLYLNQDLTHTVCLDWNNVEAMVYLKLKMGDVPLKLYFHATDNLNGQNLPVYSAGGTGTPTTVISNLSNQYAWLAGVDIGALKNIGDFSGSLYVACLDPNATLAYLVDDDPSGGNAGYTNSQYVAGSLSYMADDHVTIKVSEWLREREYQTLPNVAGGTSLGGSSTNPLSTTYVDCVLSL